MTPTSGPARRGLAADLLAVLAVLAALGTLAGVLWWVLVEPAELTRAPGGAVALGELELGKRFAADGWYAVLAAVAGFLAGVGLTWWRSRDYRVTTVLLVVGAMLAAGVMAGVGWLLGPEPPELALRGQPRGATAPAQLVVDALPVYLLWPIGALAGALMVLWSSPGVPPSDTPDSFGSRDLTGPGNRQHTPR